jgi:hypothetical protein
MTIMQKTRVHRHDSHLLVLKGDQGDVLPTFIPYRGVGLPV